MDRPAMNPTHRRLAASAALFLACGSSPVRGAILNGKYEPTVDVSALAALDLDQRSIAARLASGTDEGFSQAFDVYVHGRDDDGNDGEERPSIQRLSTGISSVIKSDSETFGTFRDYYGGNEEYADEWIRAAFNGTATSTERGKYDFENFGRQARGAAIRYGTVVLNIWMGIVARLEEAASNCEDNEASNVILVDEWDLAVALYTGSLTIEDGGNGYMPYTLADVECAYFGTCRTGGKAPISPLNDRILDAFSYGQAYLKRGECDKAREKASDVKSLMTVPLVQGTLRAMHKLDAYRAQEEDTQGMGAAFGAALLPMVHACNSGNALLVHNDVTPGKILTGSYDVVKGALERSYACLGIACQDVGGILNLKGTDYVDGAEACGGVRPVEDKGGSVASSGASGDSGDSGDDLDDYFVFGEYPYNEDKNPFRDYDPDERVGNSDGHTRDPMDPARAALIAGLSFGAFGIVGGVAFALACQQRKQKRKREHSAVEFVASSTNGGDGTVDENEVI